MREHEVRRIVREEIKRVFKESGIPLNEDTPKRGSKVDTPHGPGEVLSLNHPVVRVRLNSGAIMNINRNKVITKN